VARSVHKQGAVAVIGPYNSSVGLTNLPLYTSLQVVPFHLTSTDELHGGGPRGRGPRAAGGLLQY